MSNKIPPPVITLIGALLIYYSSPFFPYLTLPAFNALPILSLVSGIAMIVSAIKSFKDYKTTINPLKPETASSLVTSGVFKYTRNPMYLGLLLILIYLSIFLIFFMKYLLKIDALLVLIGVGAVASFIQMK